MRRRAICYCSFCGKADHEVRRLVSGPMVFICNECIEMAQEVVKGMDEQAVREAVRSGIDRDLADLREGK